MKGLIIKPKWANLILDRAKTWEIRGSKTNIRGEIGIIMSASGKVFGTINLVGCEKLNEQIWEENRANHLVDLTWEELTAIYKTPYAWIMKEANRWGESVKYEHKQGCVIWVNL